MQAWYYHYRGCDIFEFINIAPPGLTKNQIKQLANSSRVVARNKCEDLNRVIYLRLRLSFNIKLYKSRAIKNRFN